jgi:hypothetical protein
MPTSRLGTRACDRPGDSASWPAGERLRGTHPALSAWEPHSHPGMWPLCWLGGWAWWPEVALASPEMWRVCGPPERARPPCSAGTRSLRRDPRAGSRLRLTGVYATMEPGSDKGEVAGSIPASPTDA